MDCQTIVKKLIAILQRPRGNVSQELGLSDGFSNRHIINLQLTFVIDSSDVVLYLINTLVADEI